MRIAMGAGSEVLGAPMRPQDVGVGVSHRPVIEDLHGLAYLQPAGHMHDYLSVLVPLLRQGSVRYRGAFYQVDGGFIVPGTSPVSVLVGALSPLMVQAAGELADGVVTWLAGPRTLGEQIVPQLHRSSARQPEGRAAPRVVAALPVAVSADTAASRQAADEVFARYAGFDNYRRLLDREGAESPGALAVTGDEAAIGKQLGRLADAGVTELWPIIFPVGDDPGRSRRETRVLLRELATTS